MLKRPNLLKIIESLNSSEHLEDGRRIYELQRLPQLAVLDTSYVRTGLHSQVSNGRSPAMIWSAQKGTIKLFMERETLKETVRKLPEFADGLEVSESDLRNHLNLDWLPHIRVVTLPANLRELDKRATEVHGVDPDDYPCAALAALLSPCILLTGNHNDFNPLGVTTSIQGRDAVLSAIKIKDGEDAIQAIAIIPTVPILATEAGIKLVIEKVGSLAWVVFVAIAVGGIYAYKQQSQKRKDAIWKVAHEVGGIFLDQFTEEMAKINQARSLLGSYAVPPPESRSAIAIVLRELAFSLDSMSAEQLYNTLDSSVWPSVTKLRQFLHVHKDDVFLEVRRGSFILGRHCTIR
ncbi:MAG: hypothetical protein M1587_11275 [Thaumarchaeota archaeon]|nr:hypothetical protein [Nitrososphaerota archaeon]